MALKWFGKLFGGEDSVLKEDSPKKNLEKEVIFMPLVNQDGGKEKSPYPKSPKEDILIGRERISTRPLERGVTQATSSFVKFKDDGEGIFKTEDYRHERAAYLVDRFLGFDLVPPTVIRQLDGKIGSVQEFIPDAQLGADAVTAEDEQGDPEKLIKKYEGQFLTMWVFDNVIKNDDRHDGNFLIKNGRLYAIDHGRSLGWGIGDIPAESNFGEGGFSLYGPRGSTFYGKPLPGHVVDKFKKFLEWEMGADILRDLLSELLRAEIAANVVKRIQNIGKIIVEQGMIPVPNK